MHRRFLFPLAAGVIGLIAISPVLAAESDTPDKKSSPTKATSSTVASSDDPSDPGASDDSGDPADDPSADSGDNSGSRSGSDSEGSDSGGSDSGTEPGNGSGSGGGQRSSSVCDPPVTDRGPAPQMGEEAQTHEAGEAGTVDVERLSDTELRIAGAKANDGWTEQVSAASGPRVTVKFTRQGESPSLVRFAAQMDQRGTMIHVRVTSCG